MAKADSKSGQNQLITSPEQELEAITNLLGVKPDEIQDAIKKLKAQSQQPADHNKELDKIAALLNVEPQQAAEAVGGLLKLHIAFGVHCKNLVHSNLKPKHDGKGNWRMLVPKEAWESFVEGVTPLLINGIEEDIEEQKPDESQA